MYLTLSGLRGKVDTELTLEIVSPYIKSYASWLGNGSKIILGWDTRNSSIYLSNIVISSLLTSGINIYNAGVSPTPLILHHIHALNFNGGIIITGSHNPEDQNGIKFVDSSHSFLGNGEIDEILKYYEGKKPFNHVSKDKVGSIQQIDVLSLYKKRMELFINKQRNRTRSLKIILDPNAGTADGIIDILLKDFDNKVKKINAKFQNYPHFPRGMEPIADNLQDLRKKVQSTNADVGFAFDCDADRVTIVDNNGEVYPEDISVLLPMHYILSENKKYKSPKPVIMVTNIASSLAFEDISHDFGGELIRTPIGEQYLAKKMTELQNAHPDSLILGGEGSSGGFMYPNFNNARDGIFAACKISEILSITDENLPDLVKALPKYHAYRKNLTLENPIQVIQNLYKRLEEKKIPFTKIGNDVRVYTPEKKEWTLVHPSNTESVIRIIAESKEKNRSVELVKIMRNLMLQ